ncbi:transcriptional Coactivator p15 [Leptospira yanagawae serovar Saopaulo str. Sao Paulo = ATCC 700523]|uniref:Transcriptional regulator n=3 Tax=Leptospira TaxID=171 RepID=A0A4Z1A6G4_9LEPT|nr:MULTISPECIES: transcriptional coactivator p15/PC4 family protein [Leptospira]EOQ90012.1 transcriptional Coactivator p15 [Leptospira yanagawae serovar Saopaulo str. Sao Paulo = ATCC 700523]TGL24057.1 transcriptional regulator [Leptospira yanagawae]TGL65511.1 transcriptional regulator [Leptospira jelokensis]TGM02087.1 transcriptional regulator [Leptospira jelokensis]
MAKTGIIRDIDKGRGEVIRVEISEYKGQTFFNIRVWYTDPNGELKPTQKGIAIAPTLVSDLKEAIEEAERWLA